MTLVATALLPGLANVNRVAKFQSLQIRLFDRHAIALRDDQMAGGAFFRNDFALGALMLPIVAAIATRTEIVAKVIRIGAPARFHLRKIIFEINVLHALDGLANLLLFFRGEVRIIARLESVG